MWKRVYYCPNLGRIFLDVEIDYVEFPVAQKSINVDMDAKSIPAIHIDNYSVVAVLLQFF